MRGLGADIIPRRSALPPALEQIARTPILRGKNRKYFCFTFPDVTLNSQEYNSSIIKFPSDALFLMRQIFFAPDAGGYAVTAPLANGRLSISSGVRTNMALSNDLLPLDDIGPQFARMAHPLYMPTGIMPGSVMSFEAQNLDTIAHIFKMTLEGELIYKPDVEMLKFYNSYTWFEYVASAMSYDIVTPPTTFTEIRTHPDADFYITNVVSLNTPGNDNASGSPLGPIRTRIYLGSQGDPIMDAPIHNLNLCASYFWNGPASPIIQNHFSQPCPIPYPIRVPAGSSIYLQATRPFAVATGTIDLVLEGIKVFL